MIPSVLRLTLNMVTLTATGLLVVGCGGMATTRTTAQREGPQTIRVEPLQGSGSVEGAARQVRPTTAEVEDGATRMSRREGKLRHISCHEVPDKAWSCLLSFVGGQVVLQRAVWYPSHDELGFSVVQRKVPVHQR